MKQFSMNTAQDKRKGMQEIMLEGLGGAENTGNCAHHAMKFIFYPKHYRQ